MHSLLDKYLCQKYPKIFANRHKPMTETCMCWGLAVNEGWFYLINTLCSSIQYRIDERNKCVDEVYEWAVKLGKIPQVVALQVKEKFSGLRFYYSGGDDYVRGMVDFTESLSHNICEECGRMDEEVGRNTKGWLVTTCKKHVRNPEDFQVNDDDELVKIWKRVHEDKEEERQKKLNEAYTAEK
jgi:hypothetical protein